MTLRTDYCEDPATRYLVQEKKIVLGNHEKLWNMIHSNLKKVRGQRKAEEIDVYHYTTHLKIGAAKRYLEDLQAFYETSLPVAHLSSYPTVYELQLILTNFFGSLYGAVDSLCFEIWLLYNLKIPEDEVGFWNVKEDLLSIESMDNCLERLHQLFNDHQVLQCIGTVSNYRNSLMHRHLRPKHAILVQGTDVITVKGPREAPQAFGSAGEALPNAISNAIARRILKEEPEIEKLDFSGVLEAWTHGPLVFFPKPEKLTKLSSEIGQTDFDDRDVMEISQQSYDDIFHFANDIYQVMVYHVGRRLL